jgi:hypothetical protein
MKNNVTCNHRGWIYRGVGVEKIPPTDISSGNPPSAFSHSHIASTAEKG